jgi:hypothetical protein
MAYVDQANLAQDPLFLSRIKIAISTLAQNVAGEAKPAGISDQAHGKRQAWAYEAIRQLDRWVEVIAWMVVANPAITTASTDAQLQSAVNTVAPDAAGLRVDD